MAFRIRYSLWGVEEGGGGDVWVWMCLIMLDVVGLRYVREVKIRWVGYR
jgi:hypothetical protein